MGSTSDLKVMKPAIKLLKDWKIPVDTKVVSAHRTPEFMQEYAKKASSQSIKVIIAGAGGAAHLPGHGGFIDFFTRNRCSDTPKEVKRVRFPVIHSTNAKRCACSHRGHR